MSWKDEECSSTEVFKPNNSTEIHFEWPFEDLSHLNCIYFDIEQYLPKHAQEEHWCPPAGTKRSTAKLSKCGLFSRRMNVR